MKYILMFFICISTLCGCVTTMSQHLFDTTLCNTELVNDTISRLKIEEKASRGVDPNKRGKVGIAPANLQVLNIKIIDPPDKNNNWTEKWTLKRNFGKNVEYTIRYITKQSGGTDIFLYMPPDVSEN